MFAHLFSPLAAQGSNSSNNIAFAALIWWVIPAGAVIGAIAYVVWVSKFQDKYSNETNRSVNNFNRFQASFRAPQAPSAPQAPADSINLHDPK
jgi:uncharacterized Tic20 family protein